MKKVHVICLRYYDEKKDEITIGGIQTYITSLLSVFEEIGLKPIIYQPGDCDFVVNKNNFTVISVKVPKKSSLGLIKRRLYKKCISTIDVSQDILLFATERLALKNNKIRSIAIQHGISWDIETSYCVSRFSNIKRILLNAVKAISLTREASCVNTLVCVDYNYINWYRTQIEHREMMYKVIPNFSKIPTENNANKQCSENINIIFARRLQPHRGTRCFANVGKKILESYKNVNIIFAGDGPDSDYLTDFFKGYSNVYFTTYRSEDSLKIHLDKQIAVVPTMGSEGTSLSLIEAMAAKCAVVCTDVGGLTNIVINNHNGILCRPLEDDIYASLVSLIENENLRIRLSYNAYTTVVDSFGFDRWKNEWIEVLKSFN